MGKTNFSVISPFEEKLINEKSLSSELERLLWEQRESNPRPSACKADALNQLSYAPFLLILSDNCVRLSLQSVTTIRLLPPSSFLFLVLEQNKLRSFLFGYFVLRTKSASTFKRTLFLFAVRTGLEPATPGVTGRYSNQLNYRTICSDLCVFLERGCKGTHFF